MAADTFSNVLGYLQMGTGNDNNAWGTNANSQIFQIFEDAIAGTLGITVTGGTVDLSSPTPPSAASLARYKILALVGSPTSTQTIILPALSKTWMVRNTTGSDVYMKTPGGTSINIPGNTVKLVFCDGSQVTRVDKDDVGQMRMCPFPGVSPGTLECDGSYILRASYPELFASIGTSWGNTDSTNFRLPPMTDTGRFPRSRIPGTTDAGIASLQGNQIGAHTHTGSVSVSGTTSSAGAHTHTATVTDPGHAHSLSNNYTDAAGNIGGFGAFFYLGRLAGGAAQPTNTATTGITVALDTQGAHTHTLTVTGSFTTDSAGGTETRPEAITVRFCIKY